jgi:carboxyl-terminal processing protease
MSKIFEYIKARRTPFTVLLVILFFGFGIFIGFHHAPSIDKITDIANKNTPATISADFEPFWKVWNTINEKYPGADQVTAEQRVNGAIEGLVGSLNDPYSVFFPPDEAKLFQSDISGTFSGIGMEVGMKDKVLTVIAPLKDTPAYKAGIKSGDSILKIDSTMTSDLTIDEAIKLIRGDKGTTVTLTIMRDGEAQPREVKIVRDVINVPTLDTELRPDGIFVVKLYSFSENSAELFRDAMQKFVNSGSDKLLLDLRGNPGGYLDSAVDMASWFLPEGKPVVIEDYGKNAEQNIYRSAGYNIFGSNLKFVILIDGGSASASEILAGAMQDYKLATLVGDQSYGKGSVQELVNITPDTLLKVTIAKWLTPNGTSISLKGLTPDYKVPITQKDLDAKKDPQMDKAVQLLLNSK